MKNEELDAAYTAVCNALADVGEPQAQRFLAMLCLGLLVRIERAEDVLPLIDQVRQRCTDSAQP